MDHWLGVIVPTFLGALFLLVSTPLMRGKVKRNRWYGVRFPSTLKDDAVWYPVNELGGRYLVVLGGCLIFVGLLGLFFIGNETTQRDIVILALAITGVSLALVVRSRVVLARDITRGSRLHEEG